jgi:hypothetical protein
MKSSTKKASAHTPGLHYNKEDLLHDYRATFSLLVKALAIGVGGAILYFFGMILYLGAYGQTKADEYVREFPDFAQQYEYKGTKLPEFADPTTYNAEHPTANEKH